MKNLWELLARQMVWDYFICKMVSMPNAIPKKLVKCKDNAVLVLIKDGNISLE